MKHWKYMLAAMVIVGCLAGCRKDKVKPEYVTLSVQFEDGNGTKSYMTPNNMQPSWVEGDTIYINKKPYRIKKDNGKFIVEGVTDSDVYNAYFFADENVETDVDSEVNSCKFTLPDVQYYKVIQNSRETTIKFGAPMVAKATSTDMSLTFKNTCAVLAIQITNNKTTDININTIEVSAKDKESKAINLYGTLTSNYNGTGCQLENTGSGGSIAKLDCEDEDTPTPIEKGHTKTFFIYVPPTDSATFTIEVKDNDNVLFSKDSKEMPLEQGKYVKVPITIKEDQTN